MLLPSSLDKGGGVSFLSNLFKGRRERSSDMARERLLTVLVHDRVKLTPDDMDRMKADIAAVLSRYLPEIDAGTIDVTLMRGDSVDYLKAELPIRRPTN
jgi:cell division topological specificity factor